jgi:hypothetical protein
MVCAKGDVLEFCNTNGMLIVESYNGDIEKYDGSCSVLVTDQVMSEYEYYYLKGKLYRRGIELISTKCPKNECLSGFVLYSVGRDSGNHRVKSGGRHIFGCYNDRGEVKLHEFGKTVVDRIFELRDAGYTYQKIKEDAGVHHVDGRKLSVSTIQIILSNRSRYESGKY